MSGRQTRRLIVEMLLLLEEDRPLVDRLIADLTCLLLTGDISRCLKV